MDRSYLAILFAFTTSRKIVDICDVNKPPNTSGTESGESPRLGAILISFGVALLVASLVWLVPRLQRFGEHPEGPVSVLISADGFSGLDLPVSKQEVEQVFKAAQEAMLQYSKESQHMRGWADVATWLAFALSSLIMVLAGILGYIDIDKSGTSIVKDDWYRNKKALARIVGVLAALATVCTGTSTKFKESAENGRKRAVELRESLIASHKDMAQTKSASEVRAILERLRADSAL